MSQKYKVGKPRYSDVYKSNVRDILVRKTFFKIPYYAIHDTVLDLGQADEICYLLNNPQELQDRLNKAVGFPNANENLKFMKSLDKVLAQMMLDKEIHGEEGKNILNKMWLELDQKPFQIYESLLMELGEKEVLINAFSKIRDLFKGRTWLMEGRGSYPYDDEKYKEEVKYLMEEFEEIEKNVWANIKTKTFEYRDKIIADYIIEQQKNGIDGSIDSKRELAMGWWNELIPTTRQNLTMRYYPSRAHTSLTGREIENIHFSEFPIVSVPTNNLLMTDIISLKGGIYLALKELRKTENPNLTNLLEELLKIPTRRIEKDRLKEAEELLQLSKDIIISELDSPTLRNRIDNFLMNK